MGQKSKTVFGVNEMKFSVLICTYNRHELLQICLESLINETLEKPDEVVIVNGGDEQADHVINSFIPHSAIEIKLIKTINKNLATSRNVGLSHCTGDIVAMTDDDAKVFPDWITQMKRVHKEHPESGAVGGLVIGTNTHSLVGKVADLITFPIWPDARYVRTLPGVNISYKKEVLKKIGLQDETLFRGEDVDFNWRVLQTGDKIFFDPAIKVYHHHRPTLRGFINQHYMYGRAYYLVRKKWPDLYCIYPHHFRKLKDFLKAGNFFAALLYEPFLAVRKIPRWNVRLAALPILFTTGFAWRFGMITQKFKRNSK